VLQGDWAAEGGSAAGESSIVFVSPCCRSQGARRRTFRSTKRATGGARPPEIPRLPRSSQGKMTARPVSLRPHHPGTAFLHRPHAGAILRLIWRERGASRNGLAERTALARSTVSQTVQALQRCGLVGEEGVGPSRGGRRPTLLRVEDDAFGLVGVDLGHAHVAVALTDLRGRILAWEERPHPVKSDPDGTRALACELIESCLGRWHRPRERLVGIGVGVPSPVVRGAARPLSRASLPAWDGRPGLELLAERFGAPVLLDNDANLGALAEHWWGAGQHVRELTYVLLGTGVGAGHLLDGKVFRGGAGAAGELGHLPLDPQGVLCTCGMRGCLTTLVDVPHLLARTEALVAETPASRLAGRPLTIAAVEEAMRAGDPLALQVVDEASRWLALGLSGLLNIIDPSLVILGGPLVRLGESWLDGLRRRIQEQAGVAGAPVPPIVVSPLAERAIALGAATHVLETALSDLTLFPTVRRGT
jgi:predicted NBD/HSP70 family sugar kinase